MIMTGYEYFPMYCPMLACNATYVDYARPEDQPRYIEETGLTGFMKVLYILYQFTLRENVEGHTSLLYVFRSLAILAEALRLLVCSMRFEFCMGTSENKWYNRSDPYAGQPAHQYHSLMRNDACSAVDRVVTILSRHMGILTSLAEQGERAFCNELFIKKNFEDTLLRIPSQILLVFSTNVIAVKSRPIIGEESISDEERIRRLTDPNAHFPPSLFSGKAIGNGGTRFDFESFFNSTRSYWDYAYEPQTFQHLLYPAQWSPQKVCWNKLWEHRLEGYRWPLVNWKEYRIGRYLRIAAQGR